MLISILVVLAMTYATPARAYAFPDCVNGPLAKTTVCDTSKDSITRATALISMFNTTELISNTDNGSPGVSRLGLPAYNWWSEALVSHVSTLQWSLSLTQLDSTAWR